MGSHVHARGITHVNNIKKNSNMSIRRYTAVFFKKPKASLSLKPITTIETTDK